MADAERLGAVGDLGGDAQVGRGTTLDVAIGGLRLTGLRAAILGLGPLASDQGLGAALILGQDVLRELVLELDAQARRMRFAPRAGWTPPPVPPAGPNVGTAPAGAPPKPVDPVWANGQPQVWDEGWQHWGVWLNGVFVPTY